MLSLLLILSVGFWTRFAKEPVAYTPDSAYTARYEERARKPVQLLYDVDFTTYFDNREYYPPYQIPQTILNFRLSPEIGVRILDRAGGKHELVAGVNYTQRLGGNWRDVQFNPIAYYRFRYRGFSVAMGAIPYTQRIRPMPEWLLYDSIAYYHPNMQGAHLSYQDQRGFIELMCDWRGAQTPERREMFRLVATDGQFPAQRIDIRLLAACGHHRIESAIGAFAVTVGNVQVYHAIWHFRAAYRLPRRHLFCSPVSPGSPPLCAVPCRVNYRNGRANRFLSSR